MYMLHYVASAVLNVYSYACRAIQEDLLCVRTAVQACGIYMESQVGGLGVPGLISQGCGREYQSLLHGLSLLPMEKVFLTFERL